MMAKVVIYFAKLTLECVQTNLVFLEACYFREQSSALVAFFSTLVTLHYRIRLLIK